MSTRNNTLPLLRIVFLLTSLVVLGLSCGGNDGTAASSANCGPGRDSCALGCAANLGCVQCVSNADCKIAKPVCALGQCYECGSNADCGTGKSCFLGNHTCQPACTSNANCTLLAPMCDPAGACVSCLVDDDCSGDRPLCEAEIARCSECRSSIDCGAAKPACNVREGVCVECLINADCPLSYDCGIDQKCHFACRSNADCKADRPFCNLTEGDCVACLANGDCPASAPICNSNSCVICATDANCPVTAPICHAQACVQCVRNADCTNPSLPTCRLGVCIARR